MSYDITYNNHSIALNVGFIFNLFLLDEELSSDEVRRKEYVDLDNNKKKTKEKITVDPVLDASSV